MDSDLPLGEAVRLIDFNALHRLELEALVRQLASHDLAERQAPFWVEVAQQLLLRFVAPLPSPIEAEGVMLWEIDQSGALDLGAARQTSPLLTYQGRCLEIQIVTSKPGVCSFKAFAPLLMILASPLMCDRSLASQGLPIADLHLGSRSGVFGLHDTFPVLLQDLGPGTQANWVRSWEVMYGLCPVLWGHVCSMLWHIKGC